MSGTVSATHTYNAHRQRTSKTVNGQTTYYLYNQSGQLLAELDHSGQTKVEYVWFSGGNYINEYMEDCDEDECTQ
ncbi:hypothetical protein [Marinobacterium sp. BA1]|uniref:hypothetical protein n=1 Tax=Marinobacterium sp. BA1 TaxID=3138931 RepID=UPI0032E599A1